MTVAADTTLICRDCGNPFIFTSGEQSFYAERGFVPPTRCSACRANRRAERLSMGDRGSHSASSVSRQLYPAICADCGR